MTPGDDETARDPRHVEYDPGVFQQAARRLYASAGGAIAWCMMGGLLIGYLASSAVASMVEDDIGIFVQLCGTLMAGALGMAVGYEKALEYRLRAQTALCQAQIEENTRRLLEERADKPASVAAMPLLSAIAPEEESADDGRESDEDESTPPFGTLRAFK